MDRVFTFCFVLLLASCASASTDNGQPDDLAMADLTEVESSTEQTRDILRLEIGGESFELPAGICNTYENGTFHFALAEGPVDEIGRATATVERFDTGGGHEIIVAFEGTRADGSAVTWYAQESVPGHEIVVSIFGGSIEGSARFDSIGGLDAPGDKAMGTFAIRCSDNKAT